MVPRLPVRKMLEERRGLILENYPDGALPFQIGNELCIANPPPLAWVMG